MARYLYARLRESVNITTDIDDVQDRALRTMSTLEVHDPDFAKRKLVAALLEKSSSYVEKASEVDGSEEAGQQQQGSGVPSAVMGVTTHPELERLRAQQFKDISANVAAIKDSIDQALLPPSLPIESLVVVGSSARLSPSPPSLTRRYTSRPPSESALSFSGVDYWVPFELIPSYLSTITNINAPLKVSPPSLCGGTVESRVCFVALQKRTEAVKALDQWSPGDLLHYDQWPQLIEALRFGLGDAEYAVQKECLLMLHALYRAALPGSPAHIGDILLCFCHHFFESSDGPASGALPSMAMGILMPAWIAAPSTMRRITVQGEEQVVVITKDTAEYVW